MPNLVRMSFSIEEPLLKKFEKILKERSNSNRSEFVRDLIRDQLVQDEWQRNEEALGTITLIYNHQARQLNDRLIEVQHHHHDAILATTHVHLDEHTCAEMIMVRGKASEIRHIADALQDQKGVLHTALSMSSTGKKLS
ncbi:MAG: nickel-responsive transcriptional regulator NikR [Candidatus Hydrogenedentes bacterium]|nr:nickel-responsive transcriptional regulator NikR [Candidatus Hydrogenedentota bacterium]